jgi:hypothetical protein
LQSVSDVRESYIEGDLFNKGDYVLLDNTEEVGQIVVTGSNYVIVESRGQTTRKWLTDIRSMEIGK